MGIQTVLGIAAALLCFICLGGIIYTVLYGRKESSVQNLLKAARSSGFENPKEARDRLKNDPTGQEYERLKASQKKKLRKEQDSHSPDELYFHAGIFTDRQRKQYEMMGKLLPLITAPLVGVGIWYLTADSTLTIVGLIIGGFAGVKLPTSIIERKIAARGEDILFYLPLVIEQIVIGVSSSLDIGPCLQRIIMMADERDSHNVVTELLRYAEYHIRSGASLEEALVEIGTKSGHNELKHSFIALSQVAKHGGEITKQLQELGDAVAAQRETKIEEKIKKLELYATGPVALVFVGFMLILLIGFGVQVRGAFG